MTRSARPELRGLAAVLAGATAALAAAPVAAAAEPTREYGPRNSASLNFFSLFGPGLAVEYERFVPRYASVASGLGFRATGGSQYTTYTLTPSLELRVWVYGRAPWSELGKRAMVGPFLSIREDASWTSVHDDVQKKSAGTAVELSESLGFGYRVTLWRLAVTQTHAFAMTTQLDPRGRLAPTTYLSLKLGVNLGVMF
jgi:hypothetical protein